MSDFVDEISSHLKKIHLKFMRRRRTFWGEKNKKFWNSCDRNFSLSGLEFSNLFLKNETTIFFVILVISANLQNTFIKETVRSQKNFLQNPFILTQCLFFSILCLIIISSPIIRISNSLYSNPKTFSKKLSRKIK